MTTTAKLLKLVMTKTVPAKMAMTKLVQKQVRQPALVQKQVRAWHDSPPQAPARHDSPPPVLSTTEAQSTSSTKKDFILRFDDIVSNQLHANSFYVLKSLTQEERAMVHRLANGYELFHWDESQVVRHHTIFVTIISNRPED
jgi:hypothetical protein